MGKFTGVLLASDYDNTLLNTAAAMLSGEPARLPERNADALRYFMDNGGTFAVATGRAVPAFEKYAASVPSNAPAVVCNGAGIYDFTRGEFVELIALGEEIPARCQELLDRFPSVAAEAYPMENVIHAVRPNGFTRQHATVTGVSVQVDSALTDVAPPITKILLEGDHSTLLEVQGFLQTQAWAQECEVIFSAPALLEITAKGANKGQMVLRLARRLGAEHVFCAGDEANDIPMLRVAEEGFAPANCVEAVRRCGATVVCRCDDGAIADVIGILDRRFS